MWYYRALVRMAPLRLQGNSPGKLEQARTDLINVAIRYQLNYHIPHANRQKWLHETVEHTTSLVFGLVIVCALMHLLEVTTGAHWAPLSIVGVLACVGGPATIAALHGLSSQLETVRLRDRSKNMEELLEERERVLTSLDLNDPQSVEAAWGLAAEGLNTASLLMDETAGWSLLYRNTDIHMG
jgi:hypothetical protein